MKKRIFAMFILAASMAMVACSSSSTVNEGATSGDNQALQTLEKKREFYKAQDREKDPPCHAAHLRHPRSQGRSCP